MRRVFDLDDVSLDDLCVLVHGGYGSGKTHLQGDFLRWALVQEGAVKFLNIKGEDGQKSAASHKLGKRGETVESLTDFNEFVAEYSKKPLLALAVDSLPAFYDLALLDQVGEVRYPDAKKDGERAKFLWGQVGMLTGNAVTRSRQCAKYVLWVSPHDKGEDPISGGKGITPNLPGKLAQGIAGKFDYVGYITAETLGPTNVKRQVNFAPSSTILTRQRSSSPIIKPVIIPEGAGGWEAIWKAMKDAQEPIIKEKEKV